MAWFGKNSRSILTLAGLSLYLCDAPLMTSAAHDVMLSSWFGPNDVTATPLLLMSDFAYHDFTTLSSTLVEVGVAFKEKAWKQQMIAISLKAHYWLGIIIDQSWQ